MREWKRERDPHTSARYIRCCFSGNCECSDPSDATVHGERHGEPEYSRNMERGRRCIKWGNLYDGGLYGASKRPESGSGDGDGDLAGRHDEIRDSDGDGGDSADGVYKRPAEPERRGGIHYTAIRSHPERHK
jgi:hypothetical protein